MAVFHEYLDGVVLIDQRHRGFKSRQSDQAADIWIGAGILCDYLQEETHEKGLSDVIIKPASALAGCRLFSQQGGNKGIPHTGGGEGNRHR